MMNLSEVERALSKVTEQQLDDSQRLLHGRGKCYSGLENLTIDWFDPVILITQFSLAQEVNIEKLSGFLKKYFTQNFPNRTLAAIVFQNRSFAKANSTLCYGELPQECFAQEGDLRFQIDLMNFNNVGYFLDARNARNFVKGLSKSKRVLNLFAYTCAFSVSALEGGAKSVVNLDMAKGVLERGKVNHSLNDLHFDSRSVSYVKADVFKAWKKLEKYGPYDVVIIDPPTLQKGSFDALRDYQRIIQNLSKLLSSRASIIACLNSPFLGEDFLDETLLKSALNSKADGRSLQKKMRIPNPSAFVEIDPLAGLKAVHYQYECV